MPNTLPLSSVRFWRLLIQWGFLAWIVFIGIQFGRFVHHFTSGGTAPFVARPPGVEGFLPIGALASTKHWLLTGEINPLHPAALVLFVTFVVMSLLAKKSFCSWLCPVGTLSEGLWKLGRAVLGWNFRLWVWLDVVLRGLKYALLFFFAKLLLFDMPLRALAGFLRSPYWAMSDVKMLHFFTEPSFDTVAVVGALVCLSLLFQNPWCRYLCPYGALVGLVSLFSPMKIRRYAPNCNRCGRCSEVCPAQLPVADKRVVRSVECTGCLSCVDSCHTDALQMAPPLVKHCPRWVFPLLVVGVYAAGVGLGMASGHWESSLSYADYQQLIPRLHQLGF